MIDRVFQKLPLSQIKPEGHLQRQLELQARGLTGNIAELWPDLSDRSAWLGGDGEAWERGPYFMDGLLPLSALLPHNEALGQQAKKWVEAVLASQREDGFFGPERNPDWWPRFVILKALVPHYHATGDERIIVFIKRFLGFLYAHIDRSPPAFWAAARALEAFEAIELVYRLRGLEYLPELVKKLKGYMYDWFTSFENWPYPKPTTAYINRGAFNLFKHIGEPLEQCLTKRRKILKPGSRKRILKFNHNRFVRTFSLTHGVNLAMALKYPAVYGLLTGDRSLYRLPLMGYDQLMHHHGTATGIWTADEHLNGPNPSGGTELCAVAEMLYSLEELLSITGDPHYADLLELVGYNALPATFTPDMCCHQYVQQVNQIAADKRKRQFYDTKSDANVYGLEPNFGCCAANMHQAFPKFAASACFKISGGLAFMLYQPCMVSTTVDGAPLIIRVNTEYPFSDSVRLEIIETPETNKPVTLVFRIPALTGGEVLYNGENRGFYPAGAHQMRQILHSGDEIKLKFKAPVSVCANPDGSISLRKGSLLLALKLKEIYVPLDGPEPFNYRQYLTGGAWNFAPLLKSGRAQVTGVKHNAVAARPFDPATPPLIVYVKGVRVKNWKEKSNSAGPYPVRPLTCDTAEPLEMVPYGCTNIRIAQFPIIDEGATK